MDTHGNNTGADVNAIRNSNESFKAEIQQRNDANLRNINKLLTDSLAPMHARIETCAHGIGEHKDSMMAVQRDLQRELQKTCDGQFGALQKKLTDDHARLSRDFGDQLNGTHGRWQQASEDLSANVQRLERGLNNCESRLVSFDKRQGDLLPNIQRLERGLSNCEGRLEQKMGELNTRLKEQFQKNIEEVEQLSNNLEAIQRSWGNAGFCEMIKRKPQLSAAVLINDMDGTMGATIQMATNSRRVLT